MKGPADYGDIPGHELAPWPATSWGLESCLRGLAMLELGYALAPDLLSSGRVVRPNDGVATTGDARMTDFRHRPTGVFDDQPGHGVVLAVDRQEEHRPVGYPADVVHRPDSDCPCWGEWRRFDTPTSGSAEILADSAKPPSTSSNRLTGFLSLDQPIGQGFWPAQRRTIHQYTQQLASIPLAFHV